MWKYWSRKRTLGKNYKIPNKKYGLWLIIVYQYWLVSYDKVPYYNKMLIIGETECEEYRNFLYCLCNLSVNLKTILKDLF